MPKMRNLGQLARELPFLPLGVEARILSSEPGPRPNFAYARLAARDGSLYTAFLYQPFKGI